MVLKTNIISIAVALLIKSSFSYCEATHALSHSPSSCIFSYNYTDPSCTNFQVTQCSFEVCIQYSGYGEEHQCQRYQTQYDSTWAGCTSRCCNPSISYTQAYGAFRQCQDYLDYKLERGIIIAASIGGAIFFIIVVICICKKDKVCSCLRQFTSAIGEQNHMNMMPNRLPVAKEWINQMEVNQRLKQDCSICLQRGPSLQLQCGHVYHLACIIACIRKKWQCSLCRSNQINNIRVYCEGCFSCYIETTLKGFEGQQLSGMQCNGCKQVKMMEQKRL